VTLSKTRGGLRGHRTVQAKCRCHRRQGPHCLPASVFRGPCAEIGPSLSILHPPLPNASHVLAAKRLQKQPRPPSAVEGSTLADPGAELAAELPRVNEGSAFTEIPAGSSLPAEWPMCVRSWTGWSLLRPACKPIEAPRSPAHPGGRYRSGRVCWTSAPRCRPVAD
jgi:hypothetical protein